MERKTEHNIILDLLRIIAMGMVLLVHIPIYIKLPWTFPNGQYGVAVFFVLSGYLIMESLERSKGILEFYKKRLLRILPEYYMILILGILVWDILLHKMPADSLLHLGWLRYFLCLNTWIPSNDYYYWNDLWGLWTISCFVFFYLVAPLLKKWIRNFKMSLVALAGSVVVGYGCKLIVKKVMITIGLENADIFSGDTPMFNLMIFMIGVCAWYAAKEGKRELYLFGCAIMVAAMLFLGKANRITWGLLAVILLLAGLQLTVQNHVLQICIRILSKYSFTIYLIHFPIFQIVQEVLGENCNQLVYTVVATVLIIAGTYVIHNLSEHLIVGTIQKMKKS